MLRVVTWALVLGGITLGVLQPGDVRAVDIVEARIECPATTNLQLNWTDKIGSDPRLSIARSYEAVQHSVPFQRSLHNAGSQEIACVYKLLNHDIVVGHYSYTAKRKIVSCTGVPSRVILCRVEK
jgi:hypothetical protein